MSSAEPGHHDRGHHGPSHHDPSHPATVRPATRADTDALVELCTMVQDLHVAAHPSEFHPLDRADARIFFQDWLGLPSAVILVADVGGVPVGYLAGAEQHRPHNPFSTESHVLHVDQIGVHHDHRHAGIGGALLRAAEATASERGLSRVHLETWAFNDDAQAFFATAGFEPYMLRLWRDVSPPGTSPSAG